MPKQDPAWLDREYNNRARVPEHPLHFARWADSSAAARLAEACELDVRYGDAPNETLDIFPAARPGAPVLVFIHGGWWRALDKSDHSFIAPAFTRQGACVVLPNYTLCPAITIPGIVLQMVRALAWTHRHIATHGGDPRRISVVGHSAGGHLAAMLLACRWRAHARDLPADLVKGAMSVSGLHDLDPVMRIPHVQPDLRLTPAQVRRASPARLPAPRRGVLYTLAGADESSEFIRHNTLMQAAWGRRRVPVCETLPGLNHYSVLEALAEPGQRLQALASQLVFRG